MSRWSSTKPLAFFPLSFAIGWQMKRTTGSHRVLECSGWSNVIFAFHEKEEIGSRMLAGLAKVTGLKPEDL
jgi:predicted RNA binding protein YcfA (HicA-like mRNA interferase family)